MGCQNERRAAYLSVADIKDENNEASSRLRTNAAMRSHFAELVPSLGDRIDEEVLYRRLYCFCQPIKIKKAQMRSTHCCDGVLSKANIGP